MKINRECHYKLELTEIEIKSILKSLRYCHKECNLSEKEEQEIYFLINEISMGLNVNE